jgi:hypothetical protein
MMKIWKKINKDYDVDNHPEKFQMKIQLFKVKKSTCIWRTKWQIARGKLNKLNICDAPGF